MDLMIGNGYRTSELDWDLLLKYPSKNEKKDLMECEQSVIKMK